VAEVFGVLPKVLRETSPLTQDMLADAEDSLDNSDDRIRELFGLAVGHLAAVCAVKDKPAEPVESKLRL
jgi:hypothetical protein